MAKAVDTLSEPVTGAEERTLEEWRAALRGEEKGYLPVAAQFAPVDGRIAAFEIEHEEVARSVGASGGAKKMPAGLPYTLGTLWLDRERGDGEANEAEAHKWLLEAVDAAEDDERTPPELVSQIHNSMAIVLSSRGDFDAAIASFRAAVAACDADEDAGAWIDAANNLATALVKHGSGSAAADEAIELYSAVAALLDGVDDAEAKEMWAWTTNALGEAHMARADAGGVAVADDVAAAVAFHTAALAATDAEFCPGEWAHVSACLSAALDKQRDL